MSTFATIGAVGKVCRADREALALLVGRGVGLGFFPRWCLFERMFGYHFKKETVVYFKCESGGKILIGCLLGMFSKNFWKIFDKTAPAIRRVSCFGLAWFSPVTSTQCYGTMEHSF